MEPPVALSEDELIVWRAVLQDRGAIAADDVPLLVLAARLGARMKGERFDVRAAEDYGDLILMLRSTGRARELQHRADALLARMIAGAPLADVVPLRAPTPSPRTLDRPAAP